MRFLKGFLGSGILGISVLCVLIFTAPYTGVTLPVCRLSVAAAGLLGIPGVTLLVLLQML